MAEVKFNCDGTGNRKQDFYFNLEILRKPTSRINYLIIQLWFLRGSTIKSEIFLPVQYSARKYLKGQNLSDKPSVNTVIERTIIFDTQLALFGTRKRCKCKFCENDHQIDHLELFEQFLTEALIMRPRLCIKLETC